MSQNRLIQKIRKFPEYWKKSGILPIFFLILIFLGVASIGDVPVMHGQQNMASVVLFPRLKQSQSTVAAIPIQLSWNQPITQTAVTLESTPGLIPADTMLFLEDRQFTCKGLQDRADVYHWDCIRRGNETEFEVGIFMKSLDAVYLVDANVRQGGEPSTAATIEMFSMFTDLPGIYIDRDKVLPWLGEAVTAVGLQEGVQTQTMDGILYRVYGGKADCWLEIEIPQH